MPDKSRDSSSRRRIQASWPSVISSRHYARKYHSPGCDNYRTRDLPGPIQPRPRPSNGPIELPVLRGWAPIALLRRRSQAVGYLNEIGANLADKDRRRNPHRQMTRIVGDPYRGLARLAAE